MAINIIKFNQLIESFFLYEKNPSVAVGVSGGPDSIALVFLLDQWVKRKNGHLVALIIDHRMRKESYFESLQTKKFLNLKGIKSEILTVVKNKVKNKKMVEARKNRYEKLIQYCNKYKIFHLFLGHHFDDNIETFILRKIAGSNFEGLNCMQFVTLFGNIQILRPLLPYSKIEIILFIKKFKLMHIDDPSNYNIKYSRVAIREYLNQKKNTRNLIFSEFKLIRKNYPLYKKMIFQILNLIFIEVGSNKVILDAKQLLVLNYEIKLKIFIILIKFICSKDIQIRSKKIDIIIRKMAEFNKISLYSYQTNIRKDNDLIIISKIHQIIQQ